MQNHLPSPQVLKCPACWWNFASSVGAIRDNLWKRFGTEPCFYRHRGVLVTQSIISISISFCIAFWGISGASQQLVLYKLLQHGCSLRMFWHVFCNRLFYKSGTPTIWRFAVDNDLCLTLSALIMWKSWKIKKMHQQVLLNCQVLIGSADLHKSKHVKPWLSDRWNKSG